MTRLRVLLAGAAAVLTATLTACAPDLPTAPQSTSGPALQQAPAYSRQQDDFRGPAWKSTVYKVGDTTVTEFVVDPRQKLGYAIAPDHKIKFPAYSICDPGLSTYGPGTWDDPCVPILKKIKITARSYRNAEGHTRVDFSPALRFRSGPAGPVRLYLQNKRADASLLTIYYCPDDAPCIDESIDDPSLATHYDETSGFLWRTIKHFSGYNVAVGRGFEAELY